MAPYPGLPSPKKDGVPSLTNTLPFITVRFCAYLGFYRDGIASKIELGPQFRPAGPDAA